MSKRHTSKTRRRNRSKVLEVRVMSPRIAWFGFLRMMGSGAKVACLAAVLTGVGWAVWQGIQQAFYKNPDFQLRVIDLNANPVIDEVGVAEAAHINLTGSIFEIDKEDVAEKLKALPAVADASAEHHLPDKLVVRVVARVPRAWISCPEAGLEKTREAGAMLVDREGIAYPCPELQVASARNLPVVVLPHADGSPIQSGKKIAHPELAHCFHLLDTACEMDAEAIHWIDTVQQANKWSLLLVTRDGTEATFGLGDHEKQIQRLRAAMDHASTKGYALGTINLIPKHNVPVTLRSEVPAPKAVPVAEPRPEEIRQDKRSRDLQNLLNRN